MEEDSSSDIRKNIEQDIQRAEDEHQKEFAQKRIEIARTGLESFQSGDFVRAVQYLTAYIRTLEEWKGAPEGGLNPSHFDRSSELQEILLVAGVHWDLAKLYDRTGSAEKRQVMVHHLDKYVIFSRGMPFERACTETFRKYLAAKKCRHQMEFADAFRRLNRGAKCFIASELILESPPGTLDRLRQFREDRLRPSFLGKRFIWGYENASPWVAQFLRYAPSWVRYGLGRCLGVFSRLVQKNSATCRSKDPRSFLEKRKSH